MASADPVITDLLIYRSTPVVARRHHLPDADVRARWHTLNSFGIEQARRLLKRLLATTGTTAPPDPGLDGLAELAEEIHLGPDLNLADVFVDPALEDLRTRLATEIRANAAPGRSARPRQR